MKWGHVSEISKSSAFTCVEDEFIFRLMKFRAVIRTYGAFPAHFVPGVISFRNDRDLARGKFESFAFEYLLRKR